MKRIILLIIALFLLNIPLGCTPVRYENDYKGKIIDADTGKPVEGVVVLGVWFKAYPTPGGASHEFYDAREAVTDKNGKFSIHGMGLLILSGIVPMDVLIFKAGYEYIGIGPWRSFKIDDILKKKVRWEGVMAIIPLKKLTINERKKIGDPRWTLSAQIPVGKIKLMLGEINNDRRERGLKTNIER